MPDVLLIDASWYLNSSSEQSNTFLSLLEERYHLFDDHNDEPWL